MSRLSRPAELRTRTGGPGASQPAGPAASAGQGRSDAGRTAARRRLVEAGHAAGLVQKFPPLQVILLDEKRDFEIQRDDRIKLLALPLWQIDSLAGGEERAIGRGRAVRGPPAPHHQAPPDAGQLEQQIALLRHVEALRLYAAGHGGKLPAKLSDISVPLPVDPVTGKPFVYAVEGTTAHLRGGRAPGRGA